MATTGFALSITVVVRGGRLQLVLRRMGENIPLIVRTGLTPQNLGSLRDDLYLQLDQFWQKVGIRMEEKSVDIALEAMRHLHKLGRQLNRNIFGTHYNQVSEMFLRACPAWQAAGSEKYLAPVVEVRTPLEHLLPFEFIPVFNMNEPPAAVRKEEFKPKYLEPLAAQFLGFSTTIRRVFMDPANKASSQGVSNGPLDNTPKLSIRFFQHAGLQGAKEEGKFFNGAEWIDLRGTWPDRSIGQQEFVDELVAQIRKGSVAGGGAPQPLDHVQHFACHCNTTKENPYGHIIYLAHDKGWFRSNKFQRRVVMRELQQQLPPLAEVRAEEPYTLVFLNACGATKLTPEGASSFSDLFLRLGNRGVIGSEVRIPDSFAAAFSKLFYLNLIRGFSLGDAILRARWNLWKLKHNPLGILYAVYADPDLRVRKRYPHATETAFEQ